MLNFEIVVSFFLFEENPQDHIILTDLILITMFIEINL